MAILFFFWSGGIKAAKDLFSLLKRDVNSLFHRATKNLSQNDFINVHSMKFFSFLAS